ncbi:MAG: ASPIC/UnbV domain-containing protein, partial [Thermoplasmata archaeon]|nr:ASPIC/UnbV domain-containing protein [Thermoplasmata archaeon]
LYYTAVYEGVGSRMFRNVERDRFEDSTEESRTAVEDGWGTGWCDYDHDGDLDLAVGSQTEFRLFENGGNENHWLQVKLEGTWSNSLAIGARVKVTAGTLEMVRDVKGGRGTTSQDMFTCHFGLDDYDGDVEVAVRWPGLDTFTFVGEYSVDHRVLVSEGDVDIDASIALEVDPDSPRVGEAVDLVAIVRNEGVTTIDSVEVTFTVQGVGPVGESIRVDPIAPGESVSPGTIWQPLAEGVFTVVAQIIDVVPFDTNGDNDVASVVVTVRITNTEPIARLRVDRTEAPPGLDITFDGSESSDDSSVGRYLFEFDDGTTNDWITSPVTTHSYSIEGEYLVSL